MTFRNGHTYDNLLLLKDAGAITSSGAAQVNSTPRVLDLGDQARMEAQVVIDPSAIDTTTGDETYNVKIQGCNAVGFGSGVVDLGSITVASAARTEFAFLNQVGPTLYRYVRAYLTLGGTTPILNCTVFLAKRI